ncbi:LysR family transcriptional regulator [Chania multitudinisentens RB-25]|uniref:LysR family transcriptional regulator n=1 Tax=Chania multitudinisentens RB-25 TaxID=1441930 RepID=W0L3L7_9GAMM|nr:pca operon transcription factor PcaQ [Chania multitudinisentens]AHG18348.1 LysR family transcriptional regulator [Chania multitudinisentens RB-25]
MDNNTFFTQRIRLRHIHCFIAVAREGFLHRAAEHLNLSQPALSKTLNELETLTGVTLFDRGRHGARLTAQGEVFLAHAQRIMSALAEAGDVLAQQAHALPPPLRVGALPTAALGLLPPVIARFQQLHPHLRIQVTTMHNAALLAQLQSGELDLAIGRMAEPQMMSGLLFELLFLEELQIVVHPAHPLLRETLTLENALHYPLIVAPKGTVPRQNAEALLAANGLSLPAQRVETLSPSLARRLTLQYDYLWFVPSGAVQDDLAAGRMLPLPFSGPGTSEPVGILVRNQDNTHGALQDFITAVRREALGEWR